MIIVDHCDVGCNIAILVTVTDCYYNVYACLRLCTHRKEIKPKSNVMAWHFIMVFFIVTYTKMYYICMCVIIYYE